MRALPREAIHVTISTTATLHRAIKCSAKATGERSRAFADWRADFRCGSGSSRTAVIAAAEDAVPGRARLSSSGACELSTVEVPYADLGSCFQWFRSAQRLFVF